LVRNNASLLWKLAENGSSVITISMAHLRLNIK
jgi:hypothetical protein